MSWLQWALLARLVDADVWLRLAAPAAVQPIIMILVLAVIGGLMLAVIHAAGRVVAVLLAALPRIPALRSRSPRSAPRFPRAVVAPAGGRGARAPGAAGRRRAAVVSAG
jgi:hypothetical protein